MDYRERDNNEINCELFSDIDYVSNPIYFKMFRRRRIRKKAHWKLNYKYLFIQSSFNPLSDLVQRLTLILPKNLPPTIYLTSDFLQMICDALHFRRKI